MKRVESLEHCVCNFYNGTLLSPSPSPLFSYSNWDYFQCFACKAKYAKGNPKRICKPCGVEKMKHNFRRDGSYYYFCPSCFPPVDALVGESRIPPYFQKGLGALKTDKANLEAWNDLAAIVRKPSLCSKGSILLRGHTGCGKTSLACALGMGLMKRHLIRVRYISVLRYLNGLKSLMHDYTAQGKEDLRAQLEIGKVPVLIMDDFNKEEYRDGVEQDTIYDIVDYRYSNRLFTVFTAQSKAFGGLAEQTASRIIQMAEPYDLGVRNRRTRD